jgi:glycosyltransferase involved in cell wall biosynthesis
MRILFLSRWFPHPPDNGAKIRVYYLLKGLAEHHSIDLISFTETAPSPKSFQALHEFLKEVVAVPYKPFQPTQTRAIVGFFSEKPRSILDTYNSTFARAVSDAALRQAYDLVIASQIDMVLYARLVPTARKMLEELEISKIFTTYMEEGHPLRKLRHGLTWWKLSRFVDQLLENYDGCTVVSELERKAVLRCSPQADHIAVIPNGVDTSYYQVTNEADIEPDSMIFTGSVSYSVNYEALEYFAEQIFPIILTKCPNTRLYVTGDTGQAPINRLKLRDRIIFTGYLSDIRPALRKACVNIVPLLLGGGTRLKILEGWAAGTPIVSTSRGAEGLNYVAGRDLLIADDPRGFASSVLRLLADPALRADLRANGRALVEKAYDWHPIVGSLEEFLTNINPRVLSKVS